MIRLNLLLNATDLRPQDERVAYINPNYISSVNRFGGRTIVKLTDDYEDGVLVAEPVEVVLALKQAWNSRVTLFREGMIDADDDIMEIAQAIAVFYVPEHSRIVLETTRGITHA